MRNQAMSRFALELFFNLKISFYIFLVTSSTSFSLISCMVNVITDMMCS